MRHRISSPTGLGNPNDVLLDNVGILHNDFANAAFEFLDTPYLDYSINESAVTVGIEPTYQYERLKLIKIARNKGESSHTQGKAWGGYGSQIVKSEKKYSDYKRNSKFTRFVDKWHPILFGDS